MRHAKRAFTGGLLGACGLLLVACASAPPSVGKCAVTLRDFRSGRSFALVNESLTSASALYSRPRTDASTKVVEDETMAYLLDRFEEHGFDEIASPGDAPEEVEGVNTALTVERENGKRSAVRRAGDPVDRAEAIAAMVRDFREVYDGTFQAQTLVNPEGEDYFRQIQRKLQEKRRIGGPPQG